MDGAAAALLPRVLVEEDVRAARPGLLGVDAAPPVAIWPLRSSRRLVGAKVRAFLDAIEKAFPEKVFRAAAHVAERPVPSTGSR